MLTPAEWRVVEGVRHGLSNPAIAERLGVSTDAVKFHVGNILGKLGLDSRDEVRVWDGVRKDSVMHAKQAGGDESVERPKAVGQIARLSGDPVLTAAWFEEMLGFELLYSFADMAFVDCAGVRLMISKGDPQGNQIVYFRVNDIASAHRRLTDLGVEVVAAPHRIHVHPDGTEEWMCFFKDLDGCTLAFMEAVSRKGS